MPRASGRSVSQMAPRPTQAAPSPSPELTGFFEHPANFAVLKSINDPSPPISLRALAWFVSNGVEDDDLRKDYELKLRSFTRRRFDPFRRCERLDLRVGSDVVTTTIGQMNFFRWMIEVGLWQFVANNRARVSAEVARRTNAASRALSACPKGGATASNTPGFSQVCGRHVVVFD